MADGRGVAALGTRSGIAELGLSARPHHTNHIKRQPTEKVARREMEGKGERVGGGGEGGGVTRSAWYLFVFGPDRDMQLTRSEWCGTKVEFERQPSTVPAQQKNRRT